MYKVAYVGGDVKYGGWITFSAHLAKILGQDTIYRITTKKARVRDYGYGITEVPITPEQLYMEDYLITYIEPKYASIIQSLPPKQKIIVHDPTEVNPRTSHILCNPNAEIICVRSTIADWTAARLSKPVAFIEKPFYPYPLADVPKTKQLAYTGRIDFDKGLGVLAQVNQHVGIELIGNPNRRSIYFSKEQLVKDFVESKHRGEYGKTFADHNSVYGTYEYIIDLSKIHNDGGGLQYTFLEAEHNNCTLIISDGWITGTNNDLWRDGINCYILPQGNPQAILDIMNKPKVVSTFIPELLLNNKLWINL